MPNAASGHVVDASGTDETARPVKLTSSIAKSLPMAVTDVLIISQHKLPTIV